MAKWYGEVAAGDWQDSRGVNRVDGGSHYYHVYRTSDDRFLAVGAIEPAFYSTFMTLIGLDPTSLPPQDQRASWPEQTARVAAVIRAQPLETWLGVFDGKDGCATPILGLHDVPADPHIVARGTLVDIDGIVQPAAGPRFDRTPGSAGSIPRIGEHTSAVMDEIGLGP
jgi:alpha-methylacyl-CoA racemase